MQQEVGEQLQSRKNNLNLSKEPILMIPLLAFLTSRLLTCFVPPCSPPCWAPLPDGRHESAGTDVLSHSSQRGV